MSAGNTLENVLLDHILGAITYTPETTVYLGLSTADPLDTFAGLAEPAGSGYARVAVTNNATNFPAASAGLKSNGTAITFPSASGSWGTVTHFFIANHATATAVTNLMFFGALTTARAISSGQTPSFAIGDLDITAD
jgi:hypothetical protein